MVEKPKDAKLTYKPIPPKGRRGDSGVYTNILNEFLASDEPSAAVEGFAGKPATLVMGLNKAAMTLGVSEKVKVVRRGDDVYLQRLGK